MFAMRSRCSSAFDDPAAVRVAAALDAWLRGTEIEASLGLTPGWRACVRMKARERALPALVKLHPELRDSALAKVIIAGMRRVPRSGVRPDGADGHLWDLVAGGCWATQDHWRKLIRETGQSGS